MTEACISQFVFWSLAAVTVIGALGVVFLRNVLHSALMLGLCLFGVAGIFGALGADFLFASQILIYVGGIAVLVLFVVLLSGRAAELHARQVNHRWLAALFICALTFWSFLRAAQPYLGGASLGPAKPTSHLIAQQLLTDMAVPFELISVVLLVSLAGAVIFSKPDEEKA